MRVPIVHALRLKGVASMDPLSINPSGIGTCISILCWWQFDGMMEGCNARLSTRRVGVA